MCRKTLLAIKIKVCVLVLLGVVQLAATFFAVIPGYINVDEAIYHWMAKSFHQTGGLALRNGWDDAPARELAHRFIKVHNGKLYPQYPYLFPVVAWPFYSVAEFFGLFVLNSISFIGIVALCFSTAKRLFMDVNLALNACLILILATFAWEYSQAAWPHALALLFVIGSFRLMVGAFYAATERSAILMALAAGLVAGFAPGVRIDAILILPCLVLPFIFVRPWRPRQAFMIISGAIPGLILLAVTNFAKFGVIDPLSYGDDAGTPALPATSFILALFGALLLAWLMTRTRFSDFFYTNRKRLFFVAAGLALITVFAAPQSVEPIEQLVENGYVSLIDIRALDPGLQISGAEKRPSGAVVSAGGLRKALVQSLPYLVLLLIPITRLLQRSEDRPALAMLLLAPLIYMGYHCYAFVELMGGGLTLNARYYVACLPFIAILCSYSLRELARMSGPRLSPFYAGVTCVVTVGIYLAWTRLLAEKVDDLAFPLLVIPLLMAVLLLCLILVSLFFNFKRSQVLSVSVWALITVAFVWSGLTALTHDYPIHRRWRSVHYFHGQEVLRNVPSGSLLLADITSFPASITVIEKDSVRVGLVDKYMIEDFSNLLDLNFKAGHRVFGFFNNGLWKELETGALRSYKITRYVTFPIHTLAEISCLPQAGGS